MSDDLQGIDQNNHEKIAENIEASTRFWCPAKGRHRDHFILSAPSGSDTKKFEAHISQMLKDLVKELSISTYIAVEHKDCKHPHIHIIYDAYAPDVGRGGLIEHQADLFKTRQFKELEKAFL